MIYALYGFLLGIIIPYMSRRFAKFMPATPAYALYRLIKPNKKVKGLKADLNLRYNKLKKQYFYRSLVYGLVCAGLSFLAFWRLGEAYLGWYIMLIWGLLLLSEIDIKMLLLPDIVTIPLLLCGFVYATFIGENISIEESTIGAVVGYVLPVIATLMMLWKSVDAFGGGDIKLLAVLGAWLGVEGVVYTILLSCVIFGIYSAVKRQRAGAFGPSLAVAAIIILLTIF